MLYRLQLKNIGPAPEMELVLGRRLNLITGDNGLGKSFLLDVAWWALTRKWPRDLNSQLTSGYPARPIDVTKPAAIELSLSTKTGNYVSYSSSYSRKDESWVGKSGRPWNPGLVVYAHADGSFSVWDPARNYWKKKGNVDIQERLPGYVFSPAEVWDGLRLEVEGRQVVVGNGLLHDWASWIQRGGGTAKLMELVLRLLSPSDDPSDLLKPGPLTRISINDVRDIPSITTGYSNSVPILHASSGVRRIVALAYMMLWSWQEHLVAAQQLGESPSNQVILLVDELESHLHPKWQRTILGSLLGLAKILHQQAEIQIITATHSPLIMASAEPTFNEKTDAWFDLDLNTATKPAHVELRKREFVRRGDVGSWLTSEAFDLKEARSLEAETAIGRALELVKQLNPASQEIAEVDELLRKSLGEIDKFWMRWTAFKESREAQG